MTRLRLPNLLPLRTMTLCGLVGCAALAFPAVVRADGPPPPPPPVPLQPNSALPFQPGPAAPGVPGGPAAEGEVDPEVAALMAPDALKGLVGPIALYPDVVLGSLLPAATAPLDVLEAAAYVRAQGGRAAAVPVGVSWEPAVQSMLQFPEALVKMAEDIGWLRRLGDAVAIDHDAVLSAIQAFRADVAAAGNLPKAPQVVVTTQPPPQAGGDPVIVIEPAVPTVVYVPVYDPYVVCAPAPAPWSLYTWGIGTDCGPYGPWGWTWISWSFTWGWHHHRHHHHHGHAGGYYHDGYHHGGSSYRRGPYTYRPRYGSADVVGVSGAYGPALIKKSSKVGYHSAFVNASVQHSTGGATVLRSGGGATTSRAYGPTVGAGAGSNVSVFAPKASRPGRSLDAFTGGASGRGLSRVTGDGLGRTSTTVHPGHPGGARAGGASVFGPKAEAGATSGASKGPGSMVNGTWFRRSQDGASPAGTTSAPRTVTPPTVTPPTPTTRRFFTPRSTGSGDATPSLTLPKGTPRMGQPPAATDTSRTPTPRAFAPQFQPQFQPQHQPRFQPQVQPQHQPRTQPQGSPTPQVAPRTFQPPVVPTPQPRVFEPKAVLPKFEAPKVEPRTFFAPRHERQRDEAPPPPPRERRRR